MIYFIQDTTTQSIKIGISADPVARLRELQTAHASNLKLIAFMDGTRSDEQALHQMFTRKRGEWFEPTRDLLVYIQERTINVEALSKTKRSRSNGGRPHYKHELQGSDYLSSMARLSHYILSEKHGTLAQIVEVIYPLYREAHDHSPDLFPRLSQIELTDNLQRLIDIQTA